MEIFAGGACRDSTLKTFAHTFTEVHNKGTDSGDAAGLWKLSASNGYTQKVELLLNLKMEAAYDRGVVPTAIDAEVIERKADWSRSLTHSFGKIIEIA